MNVILSALLFIAIFKRPDTSNGTPQPVPFEAEVASHLNGSLAGSLDEPNITVISSSSTFNSPAPPPSSSSSFSSQGNFQTYDEVLRDYLVNNSLPELAKLASGVYRDKQKAHG